MFGGGPCCFPRCLVGVRVGHLFRFLCSVLFIFVLCLECPMLSGSLYCPLLIAQCCQGLCIAHSWVPNVVRVSVLSILVVRVSVLSILDCPMLSGSLYCPFLIAHSVSLTSIYKCTGASNVSIPTYDSRHICGKSLTNIS